MTSERKPKSIGFNITVWVVLIVCLAAGCGSPYKAIDLNPIKLFAAKQSLTRFFPI